MGYRSDGLWVIKGPIDHIVAAWAKCRLTIAQPTSTENLWDSFVTFRKDDTGYIRLSYEGWKWYESFPGIRFFEQIWGCLEAYRDGADAQPLSGKRLRIGEDDDDIEVGSFGDDVHDIYVSRSIQDDEPSTGEPLTTP